MTAAGAGDALWARVHDLASRLRAAGADVSLSELLDAAEGVRHIDLADRAQLRTALRMQRRPPTGQGHGMFTGTRNCSMNSPTTRCVRDGTRSSVSIHGPSTTPTPFIFASSPKRPGWSRFFARLRKRIGLETVMPYPNGFHSELALWRIRFGVCSHACGNWIGTALGKPLLHILRGFSTTAFFGKGRLLS